MDIDPVAAKEIDSSDQDRRWPAPKLIILGAITLALALTAILVAAEIIGQ